MRLIWEKMISSCANVCKKPSYLFDVLSLLVLFAVVLLLAECEELLLLLLLQLRQPLAAFLIQLAQLPVQGRQRLLRPTVGTNTQTHSTVTYSSSSAPFQCKWRPVNLTVNRNLAQQWKKLFSILHMYHLQRMPSTHNTCTWTILPLM